MALRCLCQAIAAGDVPHLSNVSLVFDFFICILCCWWWISNISQTTPHVYACQAVVYRIPQAPRAWPLCAVAVSPFQRCRRNLQRSLQGSESGLLRRQGPRCLRWLYSLEKIQF